ncbi:hydroxyacylglutathione hydrolase [Plakobranchus ocellatus]|uniref:Hydroxyacylglutathione hydrolase n=1 Tax=Plakobranchus ocellatus TaxID=259542 RepID=A0AAV4BPN5_9GAST|nr:hydroxyacylglutathione hydrolase [Plakobranchus ocellatus]
MATKAGGCLFRIGYLLYSRTRIGYYYHQKDITKARDKFGEDGHTQMTQFDYGNLRIVPIPMVSDNYAYLVQDRKNNKAVVVDPGHAAPVEKVLRQMDVEPDAILITHKHWDHSGGNQELKRAFPQAAVYGSSTDSVPDITRQLNDGDKIEFGDLSFRVLSTPGHTVGHIVYILDGSMFGTEDSLFSGDCLFLGGCGRMFEAPSKVMLSSLDKLADLNGNTKLWPGHEYAIDNLEFALHVDPDNRRVQDKLEWAKEKRENKLCTCPSTIEEERAYNPFLRTSEESILRSIGIVGDGEFSQPTNEIRARALMEIRERKDKFNYKL